MTTEQDLNYESLKSRCVCMTLGCKAITRALIKNCPKEILIDVLKSEKIIERDWELKGKKFRVKK